MATFHVSGPDGAQYEVNAPDNASDADIMAYVQKSAVPDPKTPAAQPEQPQRSDLDKRMDERVAKEAAGGFAPHASPAQYLPFGSWLDEASAGIDAGLNKVSGGRIGAPYDEAKAYQDARQRYIDNNASGLEKGAAMVGGVVASAPFGAARVFRGTTLLPEIGNAALTGAGYGALYGGGEGEGENRVLNAVKGAAIGGTVGGVAPVVARGIGNAVSYATNRGATLPPALQPFERGAVNRVADDIASSGLTPQRYAQEAQELGPQGMLLDMGEDLRGSAETLANTHGPQLPIVRGELNARRADAPDRIRAGVDRALGPERNLGQFVEAVNTGARQAAQPHYEQFHNTSIPITPEIQNVLDSIPASAFNRAQTLARADGYRQQFRLRPVNDPMQAMTGVQRTAPEAVPTGLEYDYLKRAVDDLARSAERGSNEARIYGNLARQLRTTVDTHLNAADPTQSSWARGRAIAGDGLEGREAAELGSTVFTSKRDPNIVADELSNLSQAGQTMYRHGARNNLRQIMGRAATNFGTNGDATARRALNSEFARQNVAQIAGGRNANHLARMVDAENRMAESFNEIMRNSATARRQAGQSRLPVGAGAPVNTEAPRSTGELVFAIARRGVNALMNNALGERAGRIMADQARILTARGIDRDTYVNALIQLANHRQTTAAQRDTIIRILNAVGQNTRQPLIESQTSAQAN
ncbi:hypothetical protein Hden_1589 [Hyphomicrobium denitrificans ATCC 51888]|uniref:Uncharacterized protein n=1 Tax=Hyphomicrobium denitrificans (strain ATCC 51888 / DSM 1869 / NCIMB 11706 / TK 0415) TaxID=582899 RepID=D8JQ76_HYPDA|nr:hypothetical protein [Hyphomicrobium denitrificans]ADJ21997.1 hypothetical protein Hden_0170 [Hyphomicrobium denitrificans ATCC 51888]ADJ23397.1 hypothetical protein Hden_1589 [Hyphomicrobium denitrificans ATCC 51888]